MFTCLDLEESSDEDYFSESQSENGHLNILKEEARSFPTRSSTHISVTFTSLLIHFSTIKYVSNVFCFNFTG